MKKKTTPTKTTPATTTSEIARRPPKSIEPADRTRLLNTLNDWAADGSFLALRTRAFVLLCWGSGLRLSEALALDTSVILDDAAKRLSVRSAAYLKTKTHAGAFSIPKQARAALREYVRAGFDREWIETSGPLFVGQGRRRTPNYARLNVRSAQHAWYTLLARARLSQHYKIDDLRFDAITRFAVAAKGDVRRVQMFGRFVDVNTAARYVQPRITTLAEMSELAARI